MFPCINCGASQAARQGDTFCCTACGYTWDVAHEQANATNLAAQGRNPATTRESTPVTQATPPDYESWSVSKLRGEAKRRGLVVTPAGDAAKPVKLDYVTALQADDEAVNDG